jgi:phospholipase/carboxylesterase
VVLCHGYGAPGTDLVALGPELLHLFPALQGTTRFIFPAAPSDLSDQGNPGGRAWWAIDMERLMLMQYDPEQGMARLRQEIPEELAQARRKLLALVDEATRAAKVAASKVVLGGFSQGAMLATDVTLRMEEAPAALGIFSGTLINEADWKARAAKRAGLKVFQTHGRVDPLLPFANAEALRTLLTGAGLEVEFLPFHGGHTIALEALERFGQLLTQVR